MRCVLYLRVSTDRQETSVADQREACRKYCEKHGYRIVSEYVDEGISGDATEKRAAFQKLIADAGRKRFDLIVCWDQDRFGRFDPIEGGYWIKPIRDAGVQLETINQGRVDWSDFSSRLIWTVTQEAKHAYLRDLAKNCVRGLQASVEKGVHIGSAPYGYRKENKRLVLGPEEEVEAVREIFRLKATGLGYRSIAVILSQRGVKAPGAGTWTNNQVKYILNRPTYYGCYIYGKVRRGKYATLPATYTEGTCPAIITKKDFDRANATRRTSKPHARSGAVTGRFAGLLTCGQCGSPMYQTNCNGKPGYVCSNYALKGGCGCCRVLESQMIELVGEHIAKLAGSNMEKLAKRIEKMRTGRVASKNSDRLHERLKVLQHQIQRSAERILSVDDDMLPVIHAKLKQLKEERDCLLHAIEESASATPQRSIIVANAIKALPAVIRDAPTEKSIPAIRAIISSIVVKFELARQGTVRRFYSLDGLDISLRIDSP